MGWYGVIESRCKCGDVEIRSSGALEACYERADMVSWNPGALEARRRCVDMEACSSRVQEESYRWADVDVWSSGGPLLV